MPDLLPEASSPARDFAVASVRSIIVDVPTVRRHKLSQTSVTAQSYVIVQLRLANGAEGVGEAATLGGPRWSEESVEAMKATPAGRRVTPRWPMSEPAPLRNTSGSSCLLNASSRAWSA